jgi:hypothetical protein
MLSDNFEDCHDLSCNGYVGLLPEGLKLVISSNSAVDASEGGCSMKVDGLVP